MKRGKKDMTTAGRQAKKHYKKAMRLKEGGKAWMREIEQARKYLKIALAQK